MSQPGDWQILLLFIYIPAPFTKSFDRLGRRMILLQSCWSRNWAPVTQPELTLFPSTLSTRPTLLPSLTDPGLYLKTMFKLLYWKILGLLFFWTCVPLCAKSAANVLWQKSHQIHSWKLSQNIEKNLPIQVEFSPPNLDWHLSGRSPTINDLPFVTINSGSFTSPDISKFLAESSLKSRFHAEKSIGVSSKNTRRCPKKPTRS